MSFYLLVSGAVFINGGFEWCMLGALFKLDFDSSNGKGFVCVDLVSFVCVALDSVTLLFEIDPLLLVLDIENNFQNLKTES